MEDEGGRRDLELDTLVGAAEPFDDMVDVEHQVALPVVARGIAERQMQAIDMVVVPRQLLEVDIGGGRFRHSDSITASIGIHQHPCHECHRMSYGVQFSNLRIFAISWERPVAARRAREHYILRQAQPL